jgi:hypothetical protein
MASTCFAGIAKLSEIKGEASYVPAASSEWQPASFNMELNVGDKVKTSEGSSAVIQFHSGHSAEMGEKSFMIIKVANQNKTNMQFFKGKLRSKVKKLAKGQSYKVTTPQAVCAVRGTIFDVSIIKEMTEVKVYEGIVEAKELITGEKVNVYSGQSSLIKKNQAPSSSSDFESLAPDPDSAVKQVSEEARMEMFEEISRDAVMARAAEEIKKAEYENGKALVDVNGYRVRLEEYIVRPEDNQFKYVVLNEREDRFDFSKILFAFNDTLPLDLTEVTQEMYYSTKEEKPSLILTDMISVISNTQDQINEEAWGGNMLQDSAGIWRHYFSNYEFSIKGYGKTYVTNLAAGTDALKGKILWTETKTDMDTTYEGLDSNVAYIGGSDPTTESGMPDGEDTFHFYVKDTYGDGTWMVRDDYLIDDDGNVKTSKDLADSFSSSLGGKTFKDYLSELNFESKYTSSEFDGRDIDLVYSTKLLLDSGMLSVSYGAASDE